MTSNNKENSARFDSIKASVKATSNFTLPSFPIDDASCLEGDFLSYLLLSRKINDNIIFELNKANGELSECEEMWKKLKILSTERRHSIEHCLQVLNRNIEGRNPTLTEQTRIGWLKSSLQVEDILNQDSRAKFKSKCKGFKPE